MTDDRPATERFAEFYAQAPPPWDIDRPQPAFVAAAEAITGRVLDAGCGTGENALYFASLGREVTGIDIVEQAIASARKKAGQRDLSVEFRVQDATRLEDLGETFDSVLDCGLFHTFSDDLRERYVAQLAKAVQPGGRVFLACFSDKEPPGEGPRRISQREIRDCFADGWEVESIAETRFEVRPEWEHLGFSPGGPFAWFCIIRRAAE